MPVGTINWSVSEYSETDVFLDANLRIIRVSDGHVYVNATGGAGSVQIDAGTEVYIYGYSSTSAPPTYWGPTYNRATLRASVAGVTSNTEPMYKNNSDFAVSSGNFTVSAGTTYTANVATINPFSTTGNVVQVEYVLGGASGPSYECFANPGFYESYYYVNYTFRAFDAAGNEVTPSPAVSIPIYQQFNTNEPVLYSTATFPPDEGATLLTVIDCNNNQTTEFFGAPSVNGITFVFNNSTFRYERPS
jgi:hypothetical protein